MDLRNKIANPVVRAILRSPVHRMLSGSVMLISVTGRRTGRAYTTPVMYARDGRDLVVLVGDPQRKTWWRNLRNPAQVRVLLAGHEIITEGTVLDTVTHPAEVISAFKAYGRRFPRAVPGEDPGPSVVFVRLRPSAGPSAGPGPDGDRSQRRNESGRAAGQGEQRAAGQGEQRAAGQGEQRAAGQGEQPDGQSGSASRRAGVRRKPS